MHVCVSDSIFRDSFFSDKHYFTNLIVEPNDSNDSQEFELDINVENDTDYDNQEQLIMCNKHIAYSFPDCLIFFYVCMKS